MTENIKPGDFVELEYTGRLEEPELVFDTTNKDIAKQNNLLDENKEYKPVIVCVGEHQVIAGLDNQLINKEIGKEYSTEIQPDLAFGNKRADLLKLVPASKFKQQGIKPMPGMQLNIDNSFGIVRSVSGGRVIVDFNHPLAGRIVKYDFKILKKITDDKEKVLAYLNMQLGIKKENIEVSIIEGNAEIKIKKEIPQELCNDYAKKMQELMPTLKSVKISGENSKDEKPEQKT